MIIFRYSFLPFVVLTACSAGTDDVSEPEATAQPEVAFSVKIRGNYISIDQLILEYQTNPNAFSIDYEDEMFEVKGEILKVPVFYPPPIEARELAKSAFEVFDYRLPLKVYKYPKDRRINRLGSNYIETLQVSMTGYSKEKAAKLSPNQSINVLCKNTSIGAASIQFSRCKEISVINKFK